VCSNCRAYDRRWGNWVEKDREPELLRLVKRACKRNPEHSALVGISGGKDSCYALHMMVTRYKLDVLAYTFDNGFLSGGARENIDRVVRRLGVEHTYVSTDREVEKRMYRALLNKRCADFCMMCMLGLVSAGYYLALKRNIPLIIQGICPRTEPIMPLELFNSLDYRYLVNVMKPDVAKSEFPTYKSGGMLRVFYMTFIKRVRVVFLAEYVDWNEGKIAETLKEQYGWIDYGNGAPHFDCVADPAVNYFMNQRLGVSKVVEKLSQLVRCGRLTREQALRELARQDTVEEPTDSVREICRRLDVTRHDLKPLLAGTALDYHHFRTYSRLFEKFRWVFWVTSKLGFTSESLYQKYK